MSLRRAFLTAAAASILSLSAATTASATSYASPPESGQTFEQAYVTTNVNVRSGPGTNTRIVNRLKRGDFVNVGQCQGNWCYIDAHGGNGWVSGRFIGRGQNPYHSLGPAGPGISPQEPGIIY